MSNAELTVVEPAASQPTSLIEWAVRNNQPVEKIERLIAMRDSENAKIATAAFNAAIAAAKAEIPIVSKSAVGHNNKRYADFAAYAKVVDPILGKHGLSYRFRTSQTDRITVTCILSHRDGYSEENSLAGPADTSGSKNAIQAIGSTLTYLQRYTLVQALGLAAGEDDDGRAAGKQDAPLETITEDQARQLASAIEFKGRTIEGACKRLNVETLADLPVARFANAMTWAQNLKPVEKADV